LGTVIDSKLSHERLLGETFRVGKVQDAPQQCRLSLSLNAIAMTGLAKRVPVHYGLDGGTIHTAGNP